MKTSFLFVAMLWVCSQSDPACAAAQLVSAADPRLAAPATPGGVSGAAIGTPDQRFVVFVSDAPNLTTNGHGPFLDVFRRDRMLGTTSLISAGADGSRGGDGDSLAPSVSTNGQWVAFHSDATNLTSGDTNNTTDVFLRDVNSGLTRRISASPDGSAGNGPSTWPVISADGQRVAFESLADNLTAHDTNHATDVFVADIAARTLILVSANIAGDAPGAGAATLVDMTPDGRYVLFTSTSATDPTGTIDTIGEREVYARDLTTGRTTWVSKYAYGLLPGYLLSSRDLKNPAMDAAGRHVIFQVANPNTVLLVFHDLSSGTTRLISSNGLAVAGPMRWNYRPDWSPPRLSADGRWVAFVSPFGFSSTNVNQVYVWDAETGATTLASVSATNGAAANAASDRPALSADGRTVAFVSEATDLTSAPANGSPQIYARDLVGGVTLLVTSNRLGALSDAGDCGVLDLSADGSRLLFETIDGQLADNDLNRAQDVFLRDLRTGELELVSRRDPALPCLTASGISGITRNGVSADGRYAAFTSQAGDLTTGDTGRLANVYWRDLAAGTNRLVSVNRQGARSTEGGATTPAIHANGQLVAFASNAGDLTPTDTNRHYDVFIRDLGGAACELVSATPAHRSPTNGWSGMPSFSPDGGAVIFASQAAEWVNLGPASRYYGWCARDLTAGDTSSLVFSPPTRLLTLSSWVGLSSLSGVAVFDAPGLVVSDLSAGTTTNLDSGGQDAFLSANGRWLVYVHARQALQTQLAIWDLSNNTNREATLAGEVHHPSISDDGCKLAFEAVDGSSTDTLRQIFVYDICQNARMLVSASPDHAGSGDGDSNFPQITADGSYVIFQSQADNLAPNDRNGRMDVFARDLSAATTYCLSLNSDGTSTGNGYSGNPVTSGDGRTVMFTSDATDLVPGDFNHAPDVFAARLPSVVELRLLPVEMAAGKATLRWTATVGGTYRVQYKNHLSDPLWTDVSGEVTAVSATAEKEDSSAITAAQRFYRVQLVP